MLLEVHSLGYVYNAGTPLENRALERISFSLARGEALGILGGTGSGKTTLIKNLNGLLAATTGRVILDGVDIHDVGPALRKQIGVVFQRPERQFFEETVLKDISYVLRRLTDLSEQEISRQVHVACDMVKLDLEQIRDRSPHTLTDGEKRKAAIAAILVNEPEILILDEPAVGLDPPAVLELVQLLDEMKRSRQKSIIIVSHDMEDFLPILDTLMILHLGRMVGYGTPSEVCEAADNDPSVSDILPPVALLVHRLRKAGLSLDPHEFRATVLAERLVRLWSG